MFVVMANIFDNISVYLYHHKIINYNIFDNSITVKFIRPYIIDKCINGSKC